MPTVSELLTHGSIPRHIAVIMDGNGRWAKQRGWMRPRGHRAGADAVVNCVEACQSIGVEFLTLYAFSTENWKRPAMEIEALMKLLNQFLVEKTATLMEKNVRLQTIGRLSQLPEASRRQLDETIATTRQNTGLTMILALSYGSREEILDRFEDDAMEPCKRFARRPRPALSTRPPWTPRYSAGAFTRRTTPTPNSSFAPAAKCAFPTSSSGRSATPNSSSSPSSGPISSTPTSSKPSASSSSASGGSAAFDAIAPAPRVSVVTVSMRKRGKPAKSSPPQQIAFDREGEVFLL